MTAQVSLDAHLETVNSTFADFTQFPESVIEVGVFEKKMKNYIIFEYNGSRNTPVFRYNTFTYLQSSIPSISTIQEYPLFIHRHLKQSTRNPKNLCQFRQGHHCNHFNHHNVPVHSKCIENQRHVSRYHHQSRRSASNHRSTKKSDHR